MSNPVAAAADPGGSPRAPDSSPHPPEVTKNEGGASEANESDTGGRASPVRRKRAVDPPSPEDQYAAKKAKTERSIYVYNRDQKTAEALGAKYRENSLTHFKYWYIPESVSDLNRKILLREFGKKKGDTPFPSIPSSSSSSSSQTPKELCFEPSQTSPALAAIVECNRALVTHFNALKEKLVAQNL